MSAKPEPAPHGGQAVGREGLARAHCPAPGVTALAASMMREDMKATESGVQPAPLRIVRVDISPKHDEGVLKVGVGTPGEHRVRWGRPSPERPSQPPSHELRIPGPPLQARRALVLECSCSRWSVASPR